MGVMMAMEARMCRKQKENKSDVVRWWYEQDVCEAGNVKENGECGKNAGVIVVVGRGREETRRVRGRGCSETIEVQRITCSVCGELKDEDSGSGGCACACAASIVRGRDRV